MGRIQTYLKGLFSKGRRPGEATVEDLRITFRARYHGFKLLLNANNRALEIMAEIDDAMRGKRPFGMKFVRASCTRVCTHVFQIIQRMDELAPERYEALHERYREIQEQINALLRAPDSSLEGPLVLTLEEADRSKAGQVGSKMANLGEIRNRIGLKTPNGFAVSARGYHRFLEHNDLQPEIDRRIQATDPERFDALHGLSASIQQMIIRSELPRDLEEAILEHGHRLAEEEGTGGGHNLAIRSSALGEDVAGASFAGQYRSILNVSPEGIPHAYKEVVASKYSLPAMTYRLNRGIRDEDVAMCVGCLRMVDAVSGGVLYSRNPVDPRDDSIIINATWGLPKTVVDGSTPVDLFVIAREDPLRIQHRDIPRKEHRLASYPEEGIHRVGMTGQEAENASLTDVQALDLARLAVHLEAYYQAPQDIEWALEADGSFTFLQCRPLRQVETRGQGGEEAKVETEPTSTILHGGVRASPGAAAGPVFLVEKEMDALRFPEGAVLVTTQPLPRWATVLNRAAAVVTEHGSVAGHLASVAREFGVPALFGSHGATQRLRNGQWITVDADGLRVHEGRIETLLQGRDKPVGMMEGTPLFEVLKAARGYIIPLNLLDPDSAGFKPESCRTLHDITRFCHEKSVQEMFLFGKEHHFPERSSKQLYCDVPMQWWVLNLDDGFEEEVEGKYVRLENIVSIPMLALWDGITAVTWEGPPPIDGKGFMSVMYEATRNTALTTGVPSRYANRNYFMISKNFCNLNSRLGFHFSTVEALVSDRSGENYASFQFKGGAADYERRLKRVLFVKELLETCEFGVDIRKDTLIARLEGRERHLMENRLKVLGYLTIHTRQLDMIMANEGSVNHYRIKMHRDIQAIISEGSNR